MGELWKTVMGVLGTSLAALVGYLVWRRQQRDDQTKGYSTERKAAYREIWEKLQEAEVTMRNLDGPDVALLAVTREVNSVLMKKEIYLDPDDRAIAGRYMKEFAEFVAASRDASPAVQSAKRSTAYIPVEQERYARTLAVAMEMRDTFRQKAVAVLSGRRPR